MQKTLASWGAILANSALGLAITFDYGVGKSVAWSVLLSLFGERFFVGLPFFIVAFMAVLGMRNNRWLRGSFFGSSGLMVMWALSLFFATIRTPEPQVASTIFLLYVALLKYLMAEFLPTQIIVQQIAQAVRETNYDGEH